MFIGKTKNKDKNYSDLLGGFNHRSYGWVTNLESTVYD